MNIPLIYDENIIRCYYQLVNGEIFQTILKLNSVTCRLYFVRSFDGAFEFQDGKSIKVYNINNSSSTVVGISRLLSDDLHNFQNTPDCARFNGTLYYQRAFYGNAN